MLRTAKGRGPTGDFLSGGALLGKYQYPLEQQFGADPAARRAPSHVTSLVTATAAACVLDGTRAHDAQGHPVPNAGLEIRNGTKQFCERDLGPSGSRRAGACVRTRGEG